MIKLLSVIFVFFFFYPIALQKAPILSTRIILGLLGITVFSKYINKCVLDGKLKIRKPLFYIFISVILITFLSFLTNFYNSTSESAYLAYSINVFISFMGALFIFEFLRHYNLDNEEFVVNIMILAILLQSLLSFALYLNPNLQSTVYSIVYTDELRSMKIEQLSESRIIGFGRAFFYSGVYSGMGLMLIAYYIRYYDIRKYKVWYLTFLYVVIFSIGMMMARTTIIGSILSLLIVLIPSRKAFYRLSRKKTTFLFQLTIVPAIFIAIILLIFPNIIKSLNQLLLFGFEMFYNYAEEGTLETSSTNKLFRMFVLPDNIKTWLIGDGLYSDFYMSTDVGYLRLIFYFGIFGAFLYYFYQLVLIKYSFNKTLPIIFFSLYLLILNIKGITDLLPFFTILYFINNKKLSYSKKTKPNILVT